MILSPFFLGHHFISLDISFRDLFLFDIARPNTLIRRAILFWETWSHFLLINKYTKTMILNLINITVGCISNCCNFKNKTIIKSPHSQPIWLLIQVVSLSIALTLAFLYFTCYIFSFLITFNLKQIIPNFLNICMTSNSWALIDECISEEFTRSSAIMIHIFSHNHVTSFFLKH